MLIIPGSPGGDPNDKGSDIGNDISVDNIKEEKAGNGNQNPANPGQILHPHGSPIMDQMNKSRELDGKKLFRQSFYRIKSSIYWLKAFSFLFYTWIFM